MHLDRTDLPGVGVANVGATARHDRIGVIRHRNGNRELVMYDSTDPDRVQRSVVLRPEEAAQVAVLLTPAAAAALAA